MSKPHDFLSAEQRDGSELQAKEIYEETWKWLKQIGCAAKVSPQLLERYAMCSARWIQCEEMTNRMGFLSKHPTTQKPIPSPFINIGIGNLNTVANKEIFPLFKNNEIWMGATYFNGGAAYFMAPEELYEPEKMSNEKNAYFKDGKFYWRVNGVRWYTNVEHGVRHEKMQLMTTADNLKYNKALNKRHSLCDKGKLLRKIIRLYAVRIVGKRRKIGRRAFVPKG